MLSFNGNKKTRILLFWKKIYFREVMTIWIIQVVFQTIFFKTCITFDLVEILKFSFEHLVKSVIFFQNTLENWEQIEMNKTEAVSLKIWIFLVYLVGFRVQKKCKLKVSYLYSKSIFSKISRFFCLIFFTELVFIWRRNHVSLMPLQAPMPWSFAEIIQFLWTGDCDDSWNRCRFLELAEAPSDIIVISLVDLDRTFSI